MPKRTRPKGRIRESQPTQRDTVGRRLRWAIEQRPAEGRRRGLRAFQRDLEARATELERKGRRLPGVTLPSLMTYLNDEVVPGVDFLTEAADILRVRTTWLCFGEGEPTAAGEAVEKADVALFDFPAQPPGRQIAPFNDLARHALIEAWREVADHARLPLGRVEKGETHTVGGRVWMAIQRITTLPGRELNELVDLPVDAAAFNGYATTVALALRQYVERATQPKGREAGL